MKPSHQEVLERARRGDRDAQARLAAAYLHGDGVRRNRAEAARWSELAAQQGDPICQYNTSLDYLEGVGRRKSAKMAYSWARRAAQSKQAHDALRADAEVAVAWHYLNGHGVRKDVREAMHWFMRAARRGDPSAMFNLGRMQENDGQLAKAREWYRLASLLGHKGSMYRLGRLLLDERSGPRDPAEARRLLLDAAKRGSGLANRLLRTSRLEVALKSMRKGGTTATDEWMSRAQRLLRGQWIMRDSPTELTIKPNSPQPSISARDRSDGERLIVLNARWRQGLLQFETLTQSTNWKIRCRLAPIDRNHVLCLRTGKSSSTTTLLRIN